MNTKQKGLRKTKAEREKRKPNFLKETDAEKEDTIDYFLLMV